MQAVQGMPQSDPLAQLKDVHVPSEVSAWPLDWGWWCLIGLSVLSISLMIIIMRRRYLFNQPRRDALKLLAHISPADDNWAIQINTLIKRTALSYCPPVDVASLYGDKWHRLLLQGIAQKHRAPIAEALANLHAQQYASHSDNRYFNECIKGAQTWLKHVKPKLLNANLTANERPDGVRQEASHA